MLRLAVLSLLACLLWTPASAGAAYPIEPADGGSVELRSARFTFAFDAGDTRARVVMLEDGEFSDPFEPESDAWHDDFGRLESPWSTSGEIVWQLPRRVVPAFFVWRLCVVTSTTPPDDECTLGPELRRVRVVDRGIVPCRGSAGNSFFRYFSARHASCATARAVVRRWMRTFRFGQENPPRRVRVGRFRCVFRLIQTEENPYGRIVCVGPEGRLVRFYGIS